MNLLPDRYPNANIYYGYLTDRDIIKLVLLAIFLKFIAQAQLASAYVCDTDISLNIVSKH